MNGWQMAKTGQNWVIGWKRGGPVFLPWPIRYQTYFFLVVVLSKAKQTPDWSIWDAHNCWDFYRLLKLYWEAFMVAPFHAGDSTLRLTCIHWHTPAFPNMSLGTISFSHDSPHTAALALGCLCLCQCQLYFTKYEITSCVLNYERQSLPRQYTWQENICQIWSKPE